MSNTLNLGSGKWAAKEGSLLAYNSENGNFKPLPFTFDRSTSATRVNKEGLIEVVGSGEPRIDYSNDAKGALLLEPTRSNLVTYSEAFDNAAWSKTNVTVTANSTTSPSGDMNADTLAFGASGSEIVQSVSGLTAGQDYTLSIYLKVASGTTTMSFGNISYETTSITLTSEWQRFTVTQSAVSVTRFPKLVCTESVNVYAYGAQIEQGSYATSYIPTQGGAVTRNSDSCSQTPPSGIIGQTEGTMFLNIKRGVQISNTQGLFGISSASEDNRVIIWNIFTLNSLGIQIKANGANIITSQSLGVFNNGENYKIAVSYKSGEIKGYVNGLQIFNLTNTFTFTSALSEIYLNNYANNSLTEISPINELQIYNTALSDAELQALTTI